MTANQKMDPARRDAIRTLLLEEVRHSAPASLRAVPPVQDEPDHRHQTTREPKPQRSQRSRRVLLTAAAAAVIGGVVISASGLPGGGGTATAAAAQVLEHAATSTIEAVDPPMGAGQYVKVSQTMVTTVETDGVSKDTVLIQAQETLITYVPSDREEEWVLERVDGKLINAYGLPSAEFAFIAERHDYQDSVVRAKDGEFHGPDAAGPEALPTAEYLASLPRDPEDLLAVIKSHTRGQGQSANGQVLVYTADLLNTHRVPADLRAALYRALALVPGVDVVEQRVTVDGREGVALGRVEDASGIRAEIVIDPDTGMMIGERDVQVAPSPDFAEGTVTSWTTAEATVVNSAP